MALMLGMQFNTIFMCTRKKSIRKAYVKIRDCQISTLKKVLLQDIEPFTFQRKNPNMQRIILQI